jgi:serine/threonine protein kinase
MSQGKGKGENHTTGSDSRPSESSSPYSHGQVEPQRFLAAVLKSGLLKREDLKRYLEDMPKSRLVSTETLADGLVEAGALSRFQAGKLRLGISRGLMLDRYSVLSPVAKGGMATVYLGQDTRDNRIVALKVLPPGQARENRHVARFKREARLNRMVRHPGLCSLYDEGLADDIHFLVMEFIPGQSLHRMVCESGPLPISQVAKLGAEIAYALDAIHKAGLVHRDVKPSNILVAPTGNAHLIDLGLAYIPGEVGEDVEVVGGQGYIVGSMDFIAPEQTRDPTNVDGRADLYGLGCTLYFAATGKVPFEGGSNKERMRRHREEVATPLGELLPDAPSRFCALVHLLMEKDPDERFGSAGTVAADLQLLIPENQELFNAGMDGDLVAATLENLRVYNPRERTELESQLLRDTGTEFTNSQDLADPLTDLPLNWAEVETAEKRLKATGGGSLSDPNTEVPLIVQKPSGQIRTLFSTHPALSPLGRLASFWREMPLWQRLLLAALVAVWTICLLIACSVIIFRKSGV